MKFKNLVSGILLLFVAGSLVYMLAKETGVVGGEETSSTVSSGLLGGVEGVDPDVVIYFFDSDINCATCKKLEGYAREAVEQNFPEELAAGAIAWWKLDMDEPENEDLVVEFELYSKSVVLARFEDGERVRWKNLEDVWDLVYDKPAYLEYIQVNIREFMAESP